MLWQRVATAVALLAVLLPALFYRAPEPFCLLALLFVAAAAWEWARLAGYGGSVALAVGGATAAGGALAWWAGLLAMPLPWVWALAGPVWVLGGAWMLWRGAPAWRALPAAVRLGLGLALLWVAWLSVAHARIAGINFLLSVMVLVWVADIGAYFAGRTWGGRWITRKLAASISPGKSWEGVVGGMVGVLLLALAWRWADGQWPSSSASVFTRLSQAVPGLWVPAILFLTAMSVVGDLLESLVKRVAAVKDSSALLPGHGGVLDRLDALLPTIPLALLLTAL